MELDRNTGTIDYVDYSNQNGGDAPLDYGNFGVKSTLIVNALLPDAPGGDDGDKHKGDAQNPDIPFSAGSLVDNGGLAIWGFGYRAAPRAAHKVVVVLARNDRLNPAHTMNGTLTVEPGARIMLRSWFTSQLDTRVEFQATTGSGTPVDFIVPLQNWDGTNFWENTTGQMVTVKVIAKQRDTDGIWKDFPMNRGAKIGDDLFVLGGNGSNKQNTNIDRYDVMLVALRMDGAL